MLAIFERLVGIHRDKTLENERRVAIMYKKRQKLLTKKEEYMKGIESRRKLANDYVLRGFRNEAENELIIAQFYKNNLTLVSTALVNVERLTASRERADLLQTTSSVMTDVIEWMKQTVITLNSEKMFDQSSEVEELFKQVDKAQQKLVQTTDNAVRQSLTSAEMDNIRDELDEMIDDATYYDIDDEDDEETFQEVEEVSINTTTTDTQHRGEGDFQEIILARKKKTRKEEQKSKRLIPRQMTSNDLIAESAST
jgi:hypothetical protein